MNDDQRHSKPRGRGVVALTTIALVFVALPWRAALPDTWSGQLRDGSALQVDPYTRRAQRDVNGHQVPMWDGVHHLDDGSTVIVRDGIAVPTEQMYQAWEQGPAPESAYRDRWCDQLVRKACGFDNACNNSAACMRARSLLGDERREQQLAPMQGGAYAQTAASGVCRGALGDPGFAACGSLEAATGDSRCRDLVTRVCGSEEQCGDTPACDAARQLLAMETDERLVNTDPGALSFTGRQCLDAMRQSFFAPCDPPKAKPTAP